MKKKMTVKQWLGFQWQKHKADIFMWGSLLVLTGLVGYSCEQAAKKENERREQEMAEFKARQEEEAKKLEEEARRVAEENEKADKEIEENPDNQLTAGGYVRPDNNNLDDPEYPNLLANCVPLSSMGQFGQDILDKLSQAHPNWDETAVADLWVDFGHQQWMEDHGELNKQEETVNESEQAA